MIRSSAALVVLALALGVAGVADGSRSRPDRGAKLAVVTMEPLTLRGTRFLAAEKIRLTVVAGGSRFVRRPTAGRGGSFTQSLPAASLDRCDRLLAVAVGSRGSRAAIKPFQPACPVPAMTAEQRSPTLRLVDRQPLVVRGAGFRPNERVSVTVSADEESATRRLRASARGVFSASFARMALHPCDGLFASAVGASGNRATLKLKAQPQCPPS
jgi:hypothetical protein